MDAQTSRLPADLSHSPHDVKLWLVDLIKARSYKSLKALRGVNKEWKALVDPHLWSHIRLEPKPIEDLERFILDCVVHVGPHVRSLSIQQWSKTTNFQPSGERDAPYVVQDRIPAIEKVLGLPARGTRWPLGTWGERIAIVQNALLARALASCTGLERLSVTGSLDIVTHENSGGFDIKMTVDHQRVPNRVFPALQSIGKSIIELDLKMGTEYGDAHPVGHMRRFVALAPNCRHLSLHLRGKVAKRWNDHNRPELMRAIGTLKQLETLSTGGWTIWDKILENHRTLFPSTLRSLVVDNGTISVRSINTLAKHYGGHLVSLELSWLNNSLFPDVASQPFHFPKLKSLVLRAAFSAPFLRAFAGSPLEHVELFGKLSNLLSMGSRPHACRPVRASGLQPDDMTVAVILDFLKEHKSSLKKVKVYDKLLIDPPAAQLAILQWCGTNDIEAELDHTPYL